MKRRTLLSRVGGIGAVTAVAGCLTGGGEGTGTGDAGEQETLEPLTSETTASAESTETASATETSVDGETETASATETSANEETETATATSEGPDIKFQTAVENIEKCAKTCRTLTYTVQNRGSGPAPDVLVRIRVSTGGEQVYDEEQLVGTIESRSQRTGITRDIDVGVLGGRKIRNNDGEVTIELTPKAAGVSETFSYERTLDV